MRKKRVRKRYPLKEPPAQPVRHGRLTGPPQLWMALNVNHEWVGTIEAVTEKEALGVGAYLGAVEVRPHHFWIENGRLYRAEPHGRGSGITLEDYKEIREYYSKPEGRGPQPAP